MHERKNLPPALLSNSSEGGYTLFELILLIFFGLVLLGGLLFAVAFLAFGVAGTAWFVSEIEENKVGQVQMVEASEMVDMSEVTNHFTEAYPEGKDMIISCDTGTLSEEGNVVCGADMLIDDQEHRYVVECKVENNAYICDEFDGESIE